MQREFEEIFCDDAVTAHFESWCNAIHNKNYLLLLKPLIEKDWGEERDYLEFLDVALTYLRLPADNCIEQEYKKFCQHMLE